ncbi:glucosaminidase domain-containing protein [Pedobacter puniceum]|uniref:Peptidoglycan hydrolase n=1 Tax=Pedobacter puniceum TaxID=2666136 RepID=A0A7K0FNJ0_9SPHI|nr:glucosaminidase domain-containing protein [Pedobacter puniceum]MRX47483.1 LysM peptidoglycan-binding domain-containing protein [Pedobacter puniceum]
MKRFNLYYALLFVCFITIFQACSPKTQSYHKQNKQIEKTADKKTQGNYTNYNAATYIERFKNIAITSMNKYGIPASITLAQAILESGTGNSDLARYANNHFGIKCTSDWKGKGYYKDDDKKDDCFRVYNNPEESFKDHSEFLKRKRYAPLFELDKNDYEGWAYGLKQAGYATNPKYPQLLIGIIERYNLTQYDSREGRYEKIKREDRVLADINKNIPKEASKEQTTNAPVLIEGNKYVVQTGDTLYNISKRFGLTVDDLMLLNNLSDNNIKIGQSLIIKK